MGLLKGIAAHHPRFNIVSYCCTPRIGRTESPTLTVEYCPSDTQKKLTIPINRKNVPGTQRAIIRVPTAKQMPCIWLQLIFSRIVDKKCGQISTVDEPR